MSRLNYVRDVPRGCKDDLGDYRFSPDGQIRGHTEHFGAAIVMGIDLPPRATIVMNKD